MINGLKDKVQSFINRHGLIDKRDKVLIAVSGGPDSVCLAHLLLNMNYDIAIAHVNYQLRGEDSDNEEALLRAYADKWRVPLYVQRYETYKLIEERKLPLQVVARDLRYEFFEQLIEEYRYTCAATAHHADDQVESILMSLIKGNNPAVLKSIPLKRNVYVRPLAEIYKEEILIYLKENNLKFGYDYTNDKEEYLRNKVRNSIIPILSEVNPSIKRQLIDKEAWYKQQISFLQKILDKEYEEGDGENILDWSSFIMKYGEEYLSVFIAFVLEKWGLHGVDLWNSIQLKESQVGKYVSTKAGKIIRTRNGLSLISETIAARSELPISVGETVELISFDEIKIRMEHNFKGDVRFDEENVHYFDEEKLNYPLQIRNWRQGDRMRPLGMKQQKKISDILVDEKYSPLAKERLWLIEDHEKICFLAGFRISDSCKISPQTRIVLRLSIF